MQPPTAGFIVQLFGIPLAIVAVAVLVWLLFGKIASSHQSPTEYMQDLRSPNFERRWSAARDLASILPHNAQWQNDQEFAAELANELESELIDGPSGPQEIRYVHFIAEALGEFRSEAGIPALRKALSREVDRDVREAAVMGLGKLAGRLDGLHDPDAIDDLVATARDDDDPTIRVKATWILGRTRNERAINGLTSLVNDGDPEVRLNAAASLASLGSTAGLETLAEMLDSNQLRQSLQTRGLSSPQVESQLVAIPLSALQSLSLLLENLPSADLEPLRQDVEALANHGNRRIQISAKDLLIKMNSSRSKNRERSRSHHRQNPSHAHDNRLPRGGKLAFKGRSLLFDIWSAWQCRHTSLKTRTVRISDPTRSSRTTQSIWNSQNKITDLVCQSCQSETE